MLDLMQRTYDRLKSRVPKGRERLGRPLTLAEKILIGHLPAIDGIGRTEAIGGASVGDAGFDEGLDVRLVRTAIVVDERSARLESAHRHPQHHQDRADCGEFPPRGHR